MCLFFLFVNGVTARGMTDPSGRGGDRFGSLILIENKDACTGSGDRKGTFQRWDFEIWAVDLPALESSNTHWRRSGHAASFRREKNVVTNVMELVKSSTLIFFGFGPQNRPIYGDGHK